MSSESFLSTLDEYAFNYTNLKYKIDKDKVFLLNVSEFYWYIYRRNFNIDRVLTTESMEIRNLTNNNPGWHLQYSANWNDYDWLSLAKKSNMSVLQHGYGDELRGIVPAIHIKPDYILENGIKASELNIGNKVYFGSYFNKPIEWEVINITNDNYPLLITTKSIDAKVFDAIGDQSRVYSDYINYNNSDVSIVENLEYNTTFGINDHELPELIVLNEEELNKRQNNGFSLEFLINDSNGSGIKYIELPDGNKINELKFSYYFNSNSTHTIKYMDNAGNYNVFSIPVYNINVEPIVDITTSTRNWTNQDVIVDIRTSNEVLKRFENTICSNSDKANLSYNLFPNYSSYANSTFRIKASVKLIKGTNPNDYICLGFSYRDKKYSTYSYKYKTEYSNVLKIYVGDLSYDEFKDFEIEYTIPSNYSHELRTHISSNISSTLEDSIIYEFKDVEYELINDGSSDFKITSIILPNGKEVSNSNYRDIISEEGELNHKYKIVDSRGKETVKTITTKIDKTAPKLDLDYNTNITNQNIVVSINASDTTSGIRRIKLPNGNYITNLNSTYTISGDGEYTFECEDIAGNITIKTIAINNIDKENPIVSIDKNNTDWTNKGVQININTRD